MKFTFKPQVMGIIIGVLSVFILATSGLTSCSSFYPPSLSSEDKEFSITYSKGEILPVISATYVKGKNKELKEYFDKAFPLAVGHGLTPLTQLHITDVVEGTYHPEGFIGLYKWPSPSAAEAFERDPRWAPIKATRSEVFEELRISAFVLDKDLKLIFKPDHIYEVQILWLTNDHSDDYSRFIQAMEATLNEVGGRTITHLSGGQYESLRPWPHQPDRIVIQEWPNATARAAYLNSKAFQLQKHLLYSGVANVESFLTKAALWKP